MDRQHAAPFVLVLGMHRSGTSCLAGALEQCGLHLGKVSRKSKHNAKGNHEARLLRRVHEQALEARGGSWRAPGDAPLRFDADERAALVRESSDLLAHRPSGLKDPRLLLFADDWLELVDGLALVGTFRHPDGVASSLMRRDDMPREEALGLWRRYNRELVRLHAERPFPLVEFDLTDPARYCAAVLDVAGTLGLERGLDAVCGFVSAELDHARGEEIPVPENCRETYDYLLEHRHVPKTIDQVRGATGEGGGSRLQRAVRKLLGDA